MQAVTELAAAETPQQLQQQLLQQPAASKAEEEGTPLRPSPAQNAQQTDEAAGGDRASMPTLPEASPSPLLWFPHQQNLQGRNRLEPDAAGNEVYKWADARQESVAARVQASRLAMKFCSTLGCTLPVLW